MVLTRSWTHGLDVLEHVYLNVSVFCPCDIISPKIRDPSSVGLCYPVQDFSSFFSPCSGAEDVASVQFVKALTQILICHF